MSIKDNCFTIESKVVIDDNSKEKIINAIRKIFRNRKKFGDNAFAKDEKLPFELYFGLAWKNRKAVCLVLTSKAKDNLERLKYILDNINNKDLEIAELSPDIRILKPELIQTCDFERFKKKKGEKIWDTLEHNGPYFKHLLEPYQQHKAPLIYDGKEYSLNPLEEEIASFYARRIITERKSVKKFLDKKQFNDNFFKDFKTYLTPEHRKIFKEFKKLDFSKIVDKLDQLKEEKDEMKREKSSDEKMEEKIQKLEKKANYSFAYVNGLKKEIRNSSVEIPGLYIGQGNILTNKGRIKGFVNPEDVIINSSKGMEPVPPKGHKWGGIIHDNKAAWIAKYKDGITGKDKYILLAESGDLFKFEKARKLNTFISDVEDNIDSLLDSNSKRERQIGTILYLIKNYGIRAGSTESEDGGEDKSEKVVGASTLMVQNVIPEDDDKIELKFFGKDSVYFNNTLDVSPKVYGNILEFLKGKSDSDLVFDLTNASEVNQYLKAIDRDFTAKVFRTRLASSMMYDGLKEYGPEKYTKKSTDDEKVADFNEVNRQIAIRLNHKKGITDAQKASIQKDKDAIKVLKSDIKDEEKADKKKKLKERLKEKELKLREKTENLGIALETSKKNYIDPRIVKSWAMSVDLPISKIYKTEALKKHFAWTIENDDFDDSFDYLETPLDCVVGDKLTPISSSEIDVEIEEKSTKKVKGVIQKRKPKKIEKEEEVRKPKKIEKKEEEVRKPEKIEKEIESDEDLTLEEIEQIRKPKKIEKEIESDEDLTLEEIDQIRKINKFCQSKSKEDFRKLNKENQKLFKAISSILLHKKLGGDLKLAKIITEF